MDRELRQLLDEREIIGAVNDIGVGADRSDWQAVEEAFAEEVLLDYSSMGGSRVWGLLKSWRAGRRCCQDSR